MNDIFGREVKAGDKVAVGMAYNRSSVLRVGEVLEVKEVEEERGYGEYAHTITKWGVKVRWTHNGNPNSTYGEVKESTIRGDSTYSYAKLLVLPEGFVDEFPPDVSE